MITITIKTAEGTKYQSTLPDEYVIAPTCLVRSNKLYTIHPDYWKWDDRHPENQSVLYIPSAATDVNDLHFELVKPEAENVKIKKPSAA